MCFLIFLQDFLFAQVTLDSLTTSIILLLFHLVLFLFNRSGKFYRRYIPLFTTTTAGYCFHLSSYGILYGLPRLLKTQEFTFFLTVLL